MLIKVKQLTGEIHDVNVEPNDSIEIIKCILEQVTHKPAEQMRLIFAGKQLQDARTLADYNVQQGSMILILLRLIGD